MSTPQRALAAVVQMTSTEDVADNLRRAVALCERAHGRGAVLALLPENFALLSPDESAKMKVAVDLALHEGPIDESPDDLLREMRAAAARLSMHLVLGGLPERTPDPARVYNSCVHLRPDGSIGAVYRKIHLFDVTLGAQATFRESDTVMPGAELQAVLADTPLGPVGLSVCYDVRFPELYRRLSAKGARTLLVPAAFTLHTGKDHWHVLLRARAIENVCFLLAAAQQGRHSANRVTYGHSLIIDPWGTVLAECPDGEGVAVAELDFARQDQVRRDLPCLANRRIRLGDPDP